MVVLVFILAELTLTVSRYAGSDIDDAQRTGQATVVSCERHGPISKGFGYWDQCTADVVWDDGTRSKINPDKPRFFSARDIGSTIPVGDLGSDQGGQAYARADLPQRLSVTLAAGALALIAALSGMGLVWIAWQALRSVGRRAKS